MFILSQFLVFMRSHSGRVGVEVGGETDDHYASLTSLLKEGNSDLTFLIARAWSPLCCHGTVTVDISWISVMIKRNVQVPVLYRKHLKRYSAFCDFT